MIRNLTLGPLYHTCIYTIYFIYKYDAKSCKPSQQRTTVCTPSTLWSHIYHNAKTQATIMFSCVRTREITANHYLADRDNCPELLNNTDLRYKHLLMSGVYICRVVDMTSHTVQGFRVCRTPRLPNTRPTYKHNIGHNRCDHITYVHTLWPIQVLKRDLLAVTNFLLLTPMCQGYTSIVLTGTFIDELHYSNKHLK